ncbi:MAG TPA: hypothetical protein PLR28_09665 [Dokdonella sp.]|nr:hypothetical protein [Dokdonella sp.]
MNLERRKTLSPWADAAAYASRTRERVMFGLMVVMVPLSIAVALTIALLLAAIVGSPGAHGAEPDGARIERLGADGTCAFTGPIKQRIVTATCLTGLYFGQPIAAQVETGSDRLAGWLVANRPGLLSIALVNLSPGAIPDAHVIVRVSLAMPAPPHPCEVPPPELMTPRDRCIAQACAAGIEPVCIVKTSAPGTGMPGAD